MCGQAGLDLPVLTQKAEDGINDILKGFGWAANPSDVTGFANSDSFPDIMGHMINEPEVGNLVVASAGGDAQAAQVITHRDVSYTHHRTHETKANRVGRLLIDNK